MVKFKDLNIGDSFDFDGPHRMYRSGKRFWKNTYNGFIDESGNEYIIDQNDFVYHIEPAQSVGTQLPSESYHGYFEGDPGPEKPHKPRKKATGCRAKVRRAMRNRLRDLRKLWNMYKRDPEAYDDDVGNFSEYGLCFDYVAPGTFGNRQGYFRYQLSTGGPGDEFDFYANFNDYNRKFDVYKIKYRYLDWYDSADVTLKGEDEELMMEIFEFFDEIEQTHAEYKKAMYE